MFVKPFLWSYVVGVCVSLSFLMSLFYFKFSKYDLLNFYLCFLILDPNFWLIILFWSPMPEISTGSTRILPCFFCFIISTKSDKLSKVGYILVCDSFFKFCCISASATPVLFSADFSVSECTILYTEGSCFVAVLLEFEPNILI